VSDSGLNSRANSSWNPFAAIIPTPALVLAVLAFLAVEFLLRWLLVHLSEPLPLFFQISLVLLLGLSASGYVLLAGYVYRDAGRRGMPQVPWSLLTLLIPGAVGFIFYFISRRELLPQCSNCGRPLSPDETGCSCKL
jgi:hypothetical protein